MIIRIHYSITLHNLKLCIKEIIQYAINSNRPIADQKNIAIIEDYPSELPEVLLDKEKTA